MHHQRLTHDTWYKLLEKLPAFSRVQVEPSHWSDTSVAAVDEDVPPTTTYAPGEIGHDTELSCKRVGLPRCHRPSDKVSVNCPFVPPNRPPTAAAWPRMTQKFGTGTGHGQHRDLRVGKVRNGNCSCQERPFQARRRAAQLRESLVPPCGKRRSQCSDSCWHSRPC